MPLYSSSDFASLLGVSKASVSNAVKQGRIIIRKSGEIDSEHKANKAYAHGVRPEVKKHGGDKTKVKKRGPRKRKESNDDVESDVLGKLKAARQVQEKQVLRLGAAAELTQFKVDRLRGEYLPTLLVKDLFATHFQSMTKGTQHMLEGMLTELAAQKKLNRNEQVEWRKRIIEELNIMVERGIIETENKMMTIIESVMSQKSA